MVGCAYLSRIKLSERKEKVMAEKTVTAILSGYFNEGEGKRRLPEWRDELSALSTDEKRELAEGVCAITGDSIKSN
jgi:hypothetical protein